MKIGELSVGQGSVEIEATVKEVEAEPKVFQKFGRELKLQNIVVEDDSGSIKVTLWNEDVDKYKVGDKIKLTNGYVKEFQDEKQLTTGKFGKIEKLGEGGEEAAAIETDSSTTAEEPEEAAGIPDTSAPEVEEKEVEEAKAEGEI